MHTPSIIIIDICIVLPAHVHVLLPSATQPMKLLKKLLSLQCGFISKCSASQKKNKRQCSAVEVCVHFTYLFIWGKIRKDKSKPKECGSLLHSRLMSLQRLSEIQKRLKAPLKKIEKRVWGMLVGKRKQIHPCYRGVGI